MQLVKNKHQDFVSLIGNQKRVENKLFMYAEESNIHVEKPKDFHSAQWCACTRLQTQGKVYPFQMSLACDYLGSLMYVQITEVYSNIRYLVNPCYYGQ